VYSAFKIFLKQHFFLKRIGSCLFFTFLSIVITQGQSNETWIIAHRGGVVDSLHSENSLEGLEEAIRRAYTHVEVDARMTVDGHVVCYHNANLRKEVGEKGAISKMTLEEVQSVKLGHSNEPIPTFDEYCKRCAGRIQLMVDIKGCKRGQIKSYCQQIEKGLSKYNLLGGALILINQFTLNNQVPIAKYFLGKVKVSWRKSLALAQRKAKKNDNFAEEYYVFNHGDDFTKETVKAFQNLGLKVIVSINTGHFVGNKQRLVEQAVLHNISLSVDGFQIDSCYDKLLIKKEATE